jgi:hypothetical protein
VLRTLATFTGVSAGVTAVLLVAVGQLGKVDGRTLVAILVAAGVSGTVAVVRRLRGRDRERSLEER